MAGTRSRIMLRGRVEQPKRPNAQAIVAAKHKHTDAGPDRIVCLLCGEEYRAIRASHLVAKHGFEWHRAVHEYKARFGLRVAASEETCELGRHAKVGFWKARGRHWTKARLLRELRSRVRNGDSVAASEAPMSMANAARRLHGGWREALVAAGLPPDLDRKTRTWTPGIVAAEIAQLAADGEPVLATRIAEERPGLYRAALEHFECWSEAVQAAGLDPADHRYQRRVWTLDACEEHVRRRARNGRPIAAKDVPDALYQTVAREYEGGWLAFLASVGAKPVGIARRRDWTEKKVLAAIRKRRREGSGLGVRAVMADGAGLYQQGWKFFGSWSDALRAAGVDPDNARERAQWTRDAVVEALRDRAGRGMPVDAATISRDACGLYKAARRYLGDSWPDVLDAVGVGAREPRAGRKR